VAGVKEFKWSPSQNVIAAYVPGQETGQTPARIVLIEVPSRKEIRQKNLFSVAEIAMYWHPDGTYLAVKVHIYIYKGGPAEEQEHPVVLLRARMLTDADVC